MFTYQDLLRCGESDEKRLKFVASAIIAFKSSAEYRNALSGARYYAKHNETIEKYQKTLYTLSGNKIEDVYSANYKLKTLIFRRLVTQQVQYVLGNGVVLEKESNKDKLGKDFDYQLQMLAKRAMAEGTAFGFWNYDHLEVFGYADTPAQPGFCPLYDEDTAELKAGIRFWGTNIGDDVYIHYTLYEPEGITKMLQKRGEDPKIIDARKAYITTTIKTATEVQDVISQNYGVLPIVPLYANDTHESELIGIRENVDCYDFIKSGLANDIDDTSGIYWILQNSGGMDDVDLAQFIHRLKTVRAVSVEDADQVSSHTQDIPTEARRTMLEILRKDIYEDFQALDVNTLSASAKTTQEIKAAYQNQDNKCADFEYQIINFLQGIFNLAGVDDNPTFVWNKVVNQSEETNMVLTAANYLTEEIIIKHLPFLTPEEADAVLAQREKESQEQIKRFIDDSDEDEEDEEDDENDEENGE